MIKGFLEYKNIKIKYKVIMTEKDNDVFVIVKAKMKWYKFTNNIIMDKITYKDYYINNETAFVYFNKNNTYRDIEYNVRKNEFINKYVGFSNTIIMNIAEDVIMREIDKDVRVDIDNFNHREYCERDKIIKRLYECGNS